MRVCIRSVLLFELWKVKFAIIKSYSIINGRNRKKLSINISVSVRVRGVEEADPVSPLLAPFFSLYWLGILLMLSHLFYLTPFVYNRIVLRT